MHKVLPAIRTVFLVFIIVYALWAGNPWDGVTATVKLEAWHQLQRVTWIAIAWIGLETLLGWIVASFRKPRAAAPAAGRSTSQGIPPPAPGATGSPPAPPASPRS